MSKYEIKGGNIGAVGDQAHADHSTQVYKGGGVLDESQLVVLSRELERLRTEASKRAKTPEQSTIVAQLEEAEGAAKSGDRNKTLEKLKAGGAWILEIAKEIGTNVVAKLIESQIGVP